jgi:hypothetical protein
MSRYSGPVPVPLAQFEAAVRAQVARTRLNRDSSCITVTFSSVARAAGVLRRLPQLAASDQLAVVSRYSDQSD